MQHFAVTASPLCVCAVDVVRNPSTGLQVQVLREAQLPAPHRDRRPMVVASVLLEVCSTLQASATGRCRSGNVTTHPSLIGVLLGVQMFLSAIAGGIMTLWPCLATSCLSGSSWGRRASTPTVERHREVAVMCPNARVHTPQAAPMVVHELPDVAGKSFESLGVA